MTTATTTTRDDYIAALAAIFRAAGATVAISADAAEVAADITDHWHDGRHDMMREDASRACKKLRELRRRQTALRKKKKACRAKTPELPMAADDATAAERTEALRCQDKAPTPPAERKGDFNQYRVKIRAALDLYIGATGIQDAIASGAALLPQHITHANAKRQKQII